MKEIWTMQKCREEALKFKTKKDFRDTSIPKPVSEEKVATIKEKEGRLSDKEIELELVKEKNKAKELLLKEFELGLITKKEYKAKVKKIEN